MMKLFCFAASAADFNDVLAMQLQILLHSGREGPSPYLGVTVANGGVQEEDMLKVLRAESHSQVYRYLHEAGIIHVQITPLGSTFSLEQVPTPTKSDIEATVRELKTTLDSLGAHLIKSVEDAVSDTMGLRTIQKIDAVRRFVDNNFLLQNLDTLKKQFLGPYDVGYKNMQRTRREEVEAVYQQIVQECRPVDQVDTRWPFNFHGEDFDFTKKPLFYARKIPLMLTVPLDQASDYSILNFVLKAGQINRARMRDLLNRLQRKYLQQILSYTLFLGIPVSPPANHYIRDLASAVERVQNTRRRALELYDQFRLPFPSQTNPLLYIYIHDPEGRASLATEGQPFFTIFEAVHFAAKVIASFERVPRFYYSGVLRSVVLFDCANCLPILSGRVTADGSEMQLNDILSPLFIVYSTVLHESSHVYDFKSGMMLRSKLERVVSPRYSPQAQRCLKEAANFFFEEAVGFTDTNHDIARLSKVADRLLIFIQNERIGYIGQSVINEFMKLTQDEARLMSTLRFSGPLLAQREKSIDFFWLSMVGEDLPEFTSFYATINVVEEAAELFSQLADPTRQAALTLECQHNAIKQKKVWLAWNALASPNRALGETQSDMEDRLAYVEKMRSLRIHSPSKPARYAVALVLHAQTASFDMLDEANAYVWGKLKQGHRVSFLAFTGYDSDLRRVQVLQQALTPTGSRYDQPATVVIYGTDATEDVIFPQIQGLLAKAGVDFDGRRCIGRRDMGIPVMMRRGCIRTI